MPQLRGNEPILGLNRPLQSSQVRTSRDSRVNKVKSSEIQ
jgi:hypothetical protein